MPTLVPTSALVSVVLPALGRPTRQAKPLRYGCWSGAVTRPVSHRPPTGPPSRAEGTVAGPIGGTWKDPRHGRTGTTRGLRAPPCAGRPRSGAAHHPGHV